MRKRPLQVFVRHAIPLIALLLSLYTPLSAGDPYSAHYSSDTDKLLWFIHASDTHIGASGTKDSTNLQWLVSQARTVINPNFIVVMGDLTDSTNGNILGIPNGPYQVEWDQYRSILSTNGVNASFYYDIPGNHDAYNDQYFNYYLANSIQGMATGRTQSSWTRIGPWGKYHFLGVNSADNTGAPFSIFWPYGDNAGLDSRELSFINSEMATHVDASLTLVFGHHPLAPTGNNSDTYLFYGKDEFVGLMDSYGVSLYGYGHTHTTSEQFFVPSMDPGVFYFNITALGKDSPNQYTVTAIDCNGISSVTQNVGAWPVVLITTPMDRHLGGIINPYAYNVTNAAANPIRALVFDPAAVSLVQFRVNGGAWQPMTNVPGNASLWQGVWNASALPGGECTIDVQATTGSGVRTDKVTTMVVLANDPTPPSLSIVSHTNGQHVTTASITMSGTASDAGLGDNGIQQVTINGDRASNDTATGSATANWSKEVALNSGANSITVRAYDNSTNHNLTTVIFTIYYDPVQAPSVTTDPATNVTSNSVTLNGTVNAHNASTTVTFQYGLTMAYGTTVTADQSPVSGSMNTAVSKAITGLNGNMTYHYRVIGVNSAGTTNGGDLTFGTLADTTPNPFTFIDQTGVALSTVIISNTITVTGINAATPISIGGGQYSLNGGSYTSSSGMVNNGDTVTMRQTSSASYSTRTDATLTIGGVSDTFSVTTAPAPPDTAPPLLTITSHSNDQHVTTASITLSGTASDAGLGDNGIQQVTINGDRASNDTTAGSGTANWNKVVTLNSGVNPITVVAYDNSTNHNSRTVILTIYYDSVQAPSVTTDPATHVTSNSATLNGTVNPKGLSTTYYFEWGQTTAYGNVTSSQSVGSGWDNIPVLDNLAELTLRTNYHYRLVATNSEGTTYGADMSFNASYSAMPWLMLLLGE